MYGARDTKLDSDVALKVLPQAFTDDPDRLARFEREAKVLASLNHPNIGHIYGLEEAEGQKALVLELVEGPTLADRIAQGPIPVDEALPIAKQIAEALEAAHEAGVIHRDLKPANIKVKEDGTVKVLDFGLAKALDSGSRGSFTDEASVTSTAFGTEVGVILGTPTYMSPEQASGLAAGERSDVWSFGAVLFEMLTGRPPFNGSTTSHVVASILKTEPDWGLLPPAIHPAIRRLLRRCLVKELKGRIPHVGMARIEISDCLNLPGSATDESVPAPRGPLWRQPVVMALIAALAAAMVALIALGLTETEAPPLSVGRFRIPEDARNGLTLSPDGGRLVYSSASQGVPRLVIRSRDQLEVVPIPGTEGGYGPFFSPDGASLGFFAEGELKRVDLDGGPPVTLAQAENPGASWGSNGTVVFGIPSDGLMLVPANGGEPRALTAVAERERHLWPEFLPGEEAVLFTRWTAGDPPLMEIVVVSLETNEQRTLIAGTGPRFVSTGHLVFARDSSLWAVPFDEERLEVTGEPAPVVEGVQVNATGGWSHYAVAADGTLAYLPTAGDEVELSLVMVDRDGHEEMLDGIGPGDYRDVGWSPDGGRLVLTVDRTNLWTYDLARGVLAPLTTDADAVDEYPVWTPDSQRVVFTSTREGVSQLLWRAADGTGTAEPLLTAESGTTPLPGGWLPDGTTILFSEGTDLFTLRPTDETPATLALRRRVCRGCSRRLARWRLDGLPRGSLGCAAATRRVC